MEPMSKGIHRALIPVESKLHTVGVELMETSPGYHIFTQTDMVEFLYMHSKELDFMTNMSVLELGAVQSTVYAAPSCMKVMDVVKCMRKISLQAVAIVESTGDLDKELALVMVSFFMFLLFSNLVRTCCEERVGRSDGKIYYHSTLVRSSLFVPCLLLYAL